MSCLHFLADSDWRLLRDSRLTALRDTPEAFLSTYEVEACYGERTWRREAARGHWLVRSCRDHPLAVLGATPEDDIAPDERYLSYLWVTAADRRSGVATTLVTAMLARLAATGVGRAWLWVVDGNEPARRLYHKLGFVRTGDRKPLSHDPTRFEERFTRPVP